MPTDATQDWRTLPAGRELDATVAERVMGLTVCDFLVAKREGRLPCSLFGTPHYHPSQNDGTSLFYSRDIAAAWRVMERVMEVRGLHVQCNGCASPDTKGIRWCAWFEDRDGVQLESGYGVTAPLAICRAALAAMEATHAD